MFMRRKRRADAESVPLRRFLYLNRGAVDEFLAQIEGGVIDGRVGVRSRRSRAFRLNLGWRNVGAGGERQGTAEQEEARAVTDASKFQRLYELLRSRGALQFFDELPEDAFKELPIDIVLQVSGRFRLPKPVELLQKLDAAEEYLSLCDLFGTGSTDDNKDLRLLLPKIRSAVSSLEKEPLPVLFEAVSKLGYRFMSRLGRADLRTSPQDFQGEAVILGKVTSRVLSGQKEEVCSIAPRVTRLISEMNREQRRRGNIAQPPEEAVEYLLGPATVLLPIAIWR